MSEIPTSLRLLFEASLERDGDRYVIPVPRSLVENGSLSTEEIYRIALMEQMGETEQPVTEPTAATQESKEQSADPREFPGPPVSEGETRKVTIDTLGDQGDGIAKVERGFIVIVPETQPGDQATVEIMDVRENVAFAETIGDPTVR